MRPTLMAGMIILSIITPFLIVTETFPAEEFVVNQLDDEQSKLIRVYGEDYSPNIHSMITNDIYLGFLRNFSELGARHILDASDAISGSNMEARNYLIDQMNSLSNGRMEVQVLGDYMNVIGRLPGYLPGNHSAFAIVGHYDSWYSSLGANEGASGIAVMLSLIAPLSTYEWPLDIYFVATNGRYAQWGPFGIKEVANWFSGRNIDFLMIYTVEALLAQDDEVPNDQRLRMVYSNLGDDGFHLGQYWAELAETMSRNLGSGFIKTLPSTDFDYWGARYMDQTYLQERGYFPMIAIESGYPDPILRTVEDTWNNENYRYYLGREMTVAIGTSIAFTMSRAYGSVVTNNQVFELGVARSRNYYIPISTQTRINVTCRWFGGRTSFALNNPSGGQMAYYSYDNASAWKPTDVFSIPVSQKGIYQLIIENTGSETVGYELQYSYDSDIDGNDILDSKEYWLDTALFEQDSDSDTISDAYEIILGTDKDSYDSDFDTLPDAYELALGFDPTDPNDALEDMDGDSLTNAYEYSLGLNPLSFDSDGDLLPDAWELEYGLNPLVDDAIEDPDDDGRSNLEEYLQGTNPLIAESEPITIPWLWIIGPSLLIVTGIAYYAWTKHHEGTWSEY